MIKSYLMKTETDPTTMGTVFPGVMRLKCWHHTSHSTEGTKLKSR